MTLRDVVDAALTAESTEPGDEAVAELARRYAAAIDAGFDNPADVAKVGAALLSALEALHLSPRARAAAQKGLKPSGASPRTRLDELRERRARKDAAPPADAAVP